MCEKVCSHVVKSDSSSMSNDFSSCVLQVGGLGDVVTGLARACLARGHNVEVILPYYECIPDESVEGLSHETDFDCPKARFWDGTWQHGALQTSVWKGKIAGDIK